MKRRLIGMTAFLAATLNLYPFQLTGDDYPTEKEATHTPAIVHVESEEEVAELVASGAEILYRRGDLLLTYIPKSRVTKSSRSEVRRKLVNRPALDVALPAAGVTLMQEDPAYGSPDGKGVVVGICDIGFDATHPAFRDAEGNLRIGMLSEYKEAYGRHRRMESPEEILRWGCDTTDHNHATHVAGILGGSDVGNPYKGVARGAEMAISTSMLSDVGLLAGVEDIVGYARSRGKRAVVNLSMANEVGPHDGSSFFNIYLDRLIEEEGAVIFLSAGNSGKGEGQVPFRFSAGKPKFSVRLCNTAWDNWEMNGATDIWSGSAAPLWFQPIVYDADLRKIVYEFPVVDFRQEGGKGLWSLSSEDDKDWGRYFEGEVTARGGVWPWNGRYELCVEYDFRALERCSGGDWGRHTLCLRVWGEEGESAVAYSGNTLFRQVEDGPSPCSDQSISDLACGMRTISVGMMTARQSVPTLSGEDYSIKYPEGEVNAASSYGTLIDGRRMPMTVAPGAQIVSASSRFYYEAGKDVGGVDMDSEMSARYLDSAGNPFYYHHEMGTSMSSPLVAGTVACWLEVCPDLTPEDVQEIILRSNRQDYPDMENPRHGMGWFDAHRGLQLALERSGVKSVGSGLGDSRLVMTDGMLTTVTPVATTLRFYSVDGRLLGETPVASGTQRHPIPAAGGILIARMGDRSLKILR